MSFHRLFTEHPESVGETYGEHLVRATVFGGRMVIADPKRTDFAPYRGATVLTPNEYEAPQGRVLMGLVH